MNKLIQLPADGQAHHTAIEWWYFNGHLAETRRTDGRRAYAFMHAFFRADPERVLVPSLKRPLPGSPYAYFAHTILSDLVTQKSVKAIEPLCVASHDSFSRPLFFVNYVNPLGLAHGYENGEIAETLPGSFRVKTPLFDLRLRAEKRPLFEGGDGRITVCGKQSYYYSFTQLSAEGLVRAGDGWVPVAGVAWMDHQWANISWSKDRWTWFSLQFDDGTDMMCVEYDDGKKKDYLVDIIDARGRAAHYRNMRLAPVGDVWESPETGAKYPMGWRIEIPGKKAVLTVKTVLRNQEMVSGAIHYWEGPIVAYGTMDGKKKRGRGFMELAGYPARHELASEAKATFWEKIGFSRR